MFSDNRLRTACLVLVILLSCAAAAFGQQTGMGQDGGPGRTRQGRPMSGGRGGRDHRMMGIRHVLQQLNLTDAQQQQARTIFERLAESTRPQREALRNLHEQYRQGEAPEEARQRATQLRDELRQAMQRAREEVAAILTPEQRARLEQLEQERRARREERRKRSGDQQEQ